MSVDEVQTTMSTRPHRLRWIWITIILVLVAAAGGGIVVLAKSGGGTPSLPANAVLRVDGTLVSKSDYEARLKVLSALYGVVAPASRAKLAVFRQDAAKAIAVSIILDAAAHKQRIVVSDQQAQSALSKLIQQELPGGQSAFADFLQTKGITQVEVLGEVRRQLETVALFNKVTKGVPLGSISAARQLFDGDRAKMVSPEQRRIENIVVASSQAATTIARQLRAGATFADLARKYSLDSSTRTKSGDLGWMTADELDQGYATAAFAAAPGTVFGPVQTTYGWNIGVVTAVRPAHPLTFEAVASQLRSQLQDQQKLTIWRAWLAKQISAAGALYANGFKPVHPDAPPSDVPTSLPKG